MAWLFLGDSSSFWPMGWVYAPFAALAGLCWLSAALHWLFALQHLSGRVSFVTMLFRGIEAFRAENYTPRGQVLQKRFLYSFLGFLACLLLGAIAGAVAYSVTRA